MISIVRKEKIKITSIKFRSHDYIIFSGIPVNKKVFHDEKGKYFITVKSKLEDLSVTPNIGQQWTIAGRYSKRSVNTNGYDMGHYQCEKIEYATCELPNGDELIKFLHHEPDFKGIGESKASKIWQKLGSNFHEILSSDTKSNREKLNDILTDESIDCLFKGYKKYKNLQHCNFMSSHYIPAKIQHRILKYHNENTVLHIKENPYVLIHFGMSFSEVDRIAKNYFDVFINDDRRLSAALEWVIKKEVAKGHTYSYKQVLKSNLTKTLGEKQDLTDKIFNLGNRSPHLVFNIEQNIFHSTAHLLMEKVIAKRLINLSQRITNYCEKTNDAYIRAVLELPFKVNEIQSQAIINSLSHSVSCITGGAGTGKTTVLRAIMMAYDRLGYIIHAIALSGRASMRLNELVKFDTMTIAAFLHSRPIDFKSEREKHVLIIDEASMLDLPTMYKIICHISPDVKIIFTGDPAQLPPIGCGKVLSDIVNSNMIVNTKLNIVERQEASTGIPEYSCLVNDGLIPQEKSSGNVHFYDVREDDIEDYCFNLFKKINLNSDCKVICPTIKSTKELNSQIHNRYNDSTERMPIEEGISTFKLNAQILFIKNIHKEKVQNGSLGVLKKGTDNKWFVRLDTGTKIDISSELLEIMELGYAITLHKAQGSQFPKVIIALSNSTIVDRAWLYTAITRAEIEVHIVGAKQTFNTVIKRPRKSDLRLSYLKSLLGE